jgi:hypothetical protein
MFVKGQTALAAVAGALMVSASASAGFSHIAYQDVDYLEAEDDSLFVCQIFAVFDSPTDTVLSVFGSPASMMDPAHPLMFTTDDPLGFHNEAGGSDLPPNSTLLPLIPQLKWDSYLTIGTMVDDPGNPLDNITTIGLPALSGTSFSTTNGSWFTAGPQAVGLAGNHAGNAVLLAQLVVRDGYSIGGVINIQIDPNGPGGGDAYRVHDIEIGHAVPGPGALALLGLAGAMVGRGRRRTN